jgi:Uri superfamily endonuclease
MNEKIIKGIYILVLFMGKEKFLNVGKIGKLKFEKAYYAYVGSAMAGFHRLERHLNNLKLRNVENKHWHIDFIISHCKFIGWFFAESFDSKEEEKLANLLAKKLEYVKDFGSSDSRAPSHLFKDGNLEHLKGYIEKALKSLNIVNVHYRQ